MGQDQRLTALELRVAALLSRVTDLEEPPPRKEPMRTEPVLLTTAIAVVLYNVATVLGVGVDQDTVTQLVVSVGAIVAGLIAREKVSPA